VTLFYVPDLAAQSLVILSEEESGHAVRVLRMQSGDPCILVNGKGTWALAEIADPHPKRCLVAVKSLEQKKGLPPYRLHLGIAPTKQIDRFEWFIEKTTEIGVSSITPLLCDRSERKEVKNDRLMRITIAAMKQSMKAWHPEIRPMTRFTDFIASTRSEQRFIAHCYESNRQSLQSLIKPASELTILIGPEGDFSDTEVAAARDFQFEEITLGSSRLRTETAGIIACHTTALVNNW